MLLFYGAFKGIQQSRRHDAKTSLRDPVSMLSRSEPHLEVLVAELADGLPAAIAVAGDDGGQGHAVEGVVLDHGVDGHIAKDDAVADGEGLFEGVGADRVAGEAGRAGEGVGMGLLPRFAAAEDGRAVRHLDDVGHVAGSRCVEDGDGVLLLDVEHLGDEKARVERDGLAGLDVDRQAVLLLHAADALLQEGDVVACLRDVVAAAEVDPLHLRQVLAEFRLDRLERDGERIGALFAERVEVEALKPPDGARIKVAQAHAEARALRARVVDGVVLRRTLGIDAQAARDAGRECLRAELLPLSKGVEDDVVADLGELRKFRLLVGGRKDMVLFAHLLMAEPCLVEAAGRRAREVLSDQRVVVVHGEALLGEQHMRARALLHLVQDAQVVLQEVFGDDVRGRRHLEELLAVCQAPHQSTSSGSKLSFHGRPHLLRASMNGSGSNSSMFLTPGPFQVPFMMSIAPIMAGTPVV